MRRCVLLAALLALMPATQARADNVGYAHVQSPDPGGPALEVGIWYPTAAPPSEHDIELFTQDVAQDAAVSGGSHPLVVMSHGTGGSFASHYDTALELARGGFVVASVTHTADNWRDHSRASHLGDRPQQMIAVIDYMLSAWPGHGSIDPDKIGVFGFSAGGFTALVLVGGVPDFSRFGPYCATHEHDYGCNLRREHPGPEAAASAWVNDTRIRAAVVVAPPAGYVFTREGLARVAVPIQLWGASDDHILPPPDNVYLVRDALPKSPDFHEVPGADHYDLLPPCSESLAMAAPEICRDDGFDRAAFHVRFNDAVVAFFRRTLSGDRKP